MQTSRSVRYEARYPGCIVVLGILLVACAAGCDGPIFWVARRETLVQAPCPSSTRTLVFEYLHRGRVSAARGELRLDSLPKDRLLVVFSSISGSPVEQGKLTVLCPETGEAVYRSGQVQLDRAFCGKGFLSGLVFLDGLPPEATSKRCCPKHSTCRIRIHIIKDLLRPQE